MNLPVDTAARFPPKRKFRPWHCCRRTSAFVAVGYPRQGGGSQIQSGVYVAVVFDAAVLAGPLANAEWQLASHNTASGAGLAARIEAIRFDHNTPSERGFVVELAQEIIGELKVRLKG